MATNDKRLRVTEFDFDDIKDNLKTYLKAQTEFKDYDFEGSGMNILLDTNIMSQDSASSNPPPQQIPFTAAITGLFMPRNSCNPPKPPTP